MTTTFVASRRARRIAQARGAIRLALGSAAYGGHDAAERALLRSRLLTAEAAVRRLHDRLSRLD